MVRSLILFQIILWRLYISFPLPLNEEAVLSSPLNQTEKNLHLAFTILYLRLLPKHYLERNVTTGGNTQ